MRTLVLLLLPSLVAAEEPAANRFTTDLFGRLAGRDGNVFLSGYSIHAALSMTAAGARGKTAAEMKAVLRGAPPELATSEEFQLAVANALFVQKGFALERPFVDLVRKQYGAPVEAVDYVNATEPARLRINGWVEAKTKERIKDLLRPGILDKETRLVLANAIYFKAGWAKKFSKRATAPADFHLDAETSVKVPTMQVVNHLGYAEADGMFVVEIPYKGGASMVVAVAGDLDLGKAMKLHASASHERVQLHLPKFETTFSFDAAKVLPAMGMPAAFSTAADFSGITAEEPLLISNVIHKAFVSVDERGTEAAAATAVVMKRASERAPGQPRVVKVDRPFLFWIRHNETGAVLFCGRIADPR